MIRPGASRRGRIWRCLMYSDLKGKTALVTGAGKPKGIGFAIADKLASSGANIVITDMGSIPADNENVRPGVWTEMEACRNMLTDRYAVRVLLLELDVTLSDSIAAMADRVRSEFGTVDVLCNNAGAAFGIPNTIHNYDDAAWVKTMDVMLHGVFRVSRAVVPLMMEKGGSIINTSSRAAKVPPVFNGAYAVAKAGVNMLTKVMARELAENDIRVNAICPGQIMTDLADWRLDLEARFMGISVDQRIQDTCAGIPLKRMGTPGEVADLVAFLASGASAYMTGQAINITGGQLMEL